MKTESQNQLRRTLQYHTKEHNLTLNPCTHVGQFTRKQPHEYFIKCHKNALRQNRYNFQTVKATNFLPSTHHTTPFLYVNIYFAVLHQHGTDVTRSGTPWGSKPPHLWVSPVAIELFCLLNFTLRYSCAKLMYISRSTCAIISCNPRSILPIHNKFG